MKHSKKDRRSRARSKDRPGIAILTRTRLTEDQINAILRCYAERRPPRVAAQISGVSQNTIYVQYLRIRYRLVAARYYSDGLISLDEEGLSPVVREALRLRRGIREDAIYLHTAELIVWAEEFPPGLVLKHIRKIIELTGPLDRPPQLGELEQSKLYAYIRYARVELIYEHFKALSSRDEARIAHINRTKETMDSFWRAYRTASKRLERDRYKSEPPRRADR